MTQTALRLTATVSGDGKIEISSPELSPGKRVEVIILLPETDPTNGDTKAVSALELLRGTSGGRQFKSAADVEAYLRQERAAWDD